MRHISSIALALTLFGLAGTASAQGYAAPFGSKGQVTFGAERLFGFHWVKNSWDHPNNTTTSSSGTSVGFGWYFAQHLQFNQPRVGFNVPISDVVKFWPKVGLTFISVGDVRAFGLSGEANFAFFARPNWAFLVTPTLDLAPFGSQDNPAGPDSDFSSYSFGASVGLLGVI